MAGGGGERLAAWEVICLVGGLAVLALIFFGPPLFSLIESAQSCAAMVKR